MKLTIIMAIMVGIGLYFAPSDYTVINERIETDTKVEEPVVIDNIEKAKQELARINIELDEEEAQLLEDIKTFEAEAIIEIARIEEGTAVKIAEKKSRLEKIRETRNSFQ
jgi:hypothetical protein